MKKIAICLSGQPRYISDGYLNLNREILSKYDVDFFIHTWFDPNYVGSKFDFSPLNSYNRSGIWEINTIEKINELYQPLKIYYEPQKQFNIYNDVSYEKQSPIALYSMYYSIWKSNELKKEYENKNNFKYDCVIRTRFDIKLDYFNLDLDKIDLNKIYVSGEINPYPNDQLAISNSGNIDYYSELYNKIEYYHNNGYTEFVNEKILKHHLIDVGNKEIHFSEKDELYCNIIKS